MDELTRDTFDKFLKKPELLVINFYADWCAPCKSMSRLLEQIEPNYESVSFGQVDVDHAGNIVADLKITVIPCMILMRDGIILSRKLGKQNKNEIIQSINDNFGGLKDD